MGSDISFPDVTAMILAGGLGTRLKSVVADRPKVLATVRGRPFMAYLLDQLGQARVSRAVLCTGFQADAIQQAFGAVRGSLGIDYSREPSPLGTGGALRLALARITTPHVLVMNGDSYCDFDPAEFIAWSMHHSDRPSLVAAHVDDTQRFGRLELCENRVEQFLEKGRSGAGWINAGIYFLPTTLLAQIPADRAVSLESEILPAWAASGLHAYRRDLGFLDMGTPESYAQAESFFARAA
jgi:D-glycero-alpha-D-manno-heptose 1-phosphate guanylyltransferase